MFEEGRKLYTGEINAAVRGAKAAGATEIVVMDCHGAGEGYTFNSLIPEDLDPACEYVVQEEWTEYTGFLEEGCDAALFVGMHAMAGTADGVLNHTVSGQAWQNLWFNGTQVGETGINAALCGTWGCPVAARHGRRGVLPRGQGAPRRRPDDGRRQEGHRPDERAHARSGRARELIEEGAKQALSDLKAVAPYDPGRPCEVKVEYKNTTAARHMRFQHGVEFLDDRTIVSKADDWWTAWKQFFFVDS